MYRRGEDPKHDRLLDLEKLRRHADLMLAHVQEHGTPERATMLVDWAYTMARKYGQVPHPGRPPWPEAQEWHRVAVWLEAVLIGGEPTLGRHITDDQLRDEWQRATLRRFRRWV